MSCEKCGTYREAIGPMYTKSVLGKETLNYRCPNCGYSYSTPTVDQSKTKSKLEELTKKIAEQ